MSKNADTEVLFDGKTVWVNGADGGCLARFGRGGIDIHSTTEEQMDTGRPCRLCTHHQPGDDDWETFKRKVGEFYGVALSDEMKPLWLTKKA